MTLFCGWYSDRKYALSLRQNMSADVALRMSRMVPIVFAVIPTIIGAAILIGLNGSGHKGVLLFGEYHTMHTFLVNQGILGIYLTGTFGTAGSAVYSYNASNTSGHTKKVRISALNLVR